MRNVSIRTARCVSSRQDSSDWVRTSEVRTAVREIQKKGPRRSPPSPRSPRRRRRRRRGACLYELPRRSRVFLVLSRPASSSSRHVHHAGSFFAGRTHRPRGPGPVRQVDAVRETGGSPERQRSAVRLEPNCPSLLPPPSSLARQSPPSLDNRHLRSVSATNPSPPGPN